MVRRQPVRVRLTVVYAGLFVVTATILLVVVNLLLGAALKSEVAMFEPPEPPKAPADAMSDTEWIQDPEARRRLGDLPGQVLAYQWDVTVIVIAVLGVVSLGIGWVVAGRLLRPLHRITATAQRLSLSNLHERIALDGPRDELKDLADTFDDMLARLERAVDSQSRFVANASHELRTPLAIQRAAIEIGLTDPSPEQLVQVRGQLLDASVRSERLIDGLLLLAQSERGLDVREPVDLDELVRQAAGELDAGDRTMVVDVEPVRVRGDSVLLTRLVANVLQNAIRHNHPGGTVQVCLFADGLLVVRNTGPEVPEERVGELFEPFRRLHSRTRSAEGVGLGLSIVASIARAHDAEVSAVPNPGGGLVVSVRFQRDR
ncbi:ATP-binding protein [Nonomuraea sp. NPDC050310]|uniref:sensor histidine kinase n=1 Tax=Nonomuraea sp. NPDC050310 TaxID=3154935 RepID=UPI0033CB03BF